MLDESRPPTRPRWPRAIRFAARLAITVLVTWFILDRVGLQWSDARQISWVGWAPSAPLWLTSVALLTAAFLASAWIWALIVSDLGGHRLGLASAARIVLAANLGRYLPGKLWQLAGMAWLARGRGIAPGTAATAAVAGQAISIGAAAILGLPAILGGTGQTATLLILLGTICGALLLSIPGVLAWLIGLALRLSGRGAAAQGRPRGARWLLLYSLNWLGYAGAFAVFAAGAGPGFDPLATGTAFAASYVIGYLAFFAPAGIGVREASFTTLLSSTMPIEDALALSVAGRIWITAVELALAAGVLALPGGRSGGDELQEEGAQG